MRNVALIIFVAGRNYAFEALAVLVLSFACWQEGSLFLAGLFAGIGGTLLARAIIVGLSENQ